MELIGHGLRVTTKVVLFDHQLIIGNLSKKQRENGIVGLLKNRVSYLYRESEMKFKSQHKELKVYAGKKDPDKYMAHRDKKSIWVTGGVRNTTLMSRICETVREAKAWMDNPSLG